MPPAMLRRTLRGDGSDPCRRSVMEAFIELMNSMTSGRLSRASSSSVEEFHSSRDWLAFVGVTMPLLEAAPEEAEAVDLEPNI